MQSKGAMSFNRYIVECKYADGTPCPIYGFVLIDT